MRRLLRDVALWAVYYPYRWLLCALPLRAARGLASAAGLAHHALLLGRGRHARSLRAVLGAGPAAARAARAYRVAKHRTLAEHFLLASRGPAAARRLLGEVVGRERLEEARRSGAGAVLVLYHFGNFRMLAALGYEGYPLAQFLARTSAHAAREHGGWVARRVRDLKVRMDERMPARFIHWDPESRASLRDLLESPRQGEFLILHADGSRGTSFVEAEFLGARLRLPTGPARVARHVGLPLVPVFCVAREDGRHDIVVEAPVPAEGSIEEATLRCAALLEGHVRRRPDLWWTWDRLRCERDPLGTLRLAARAAATPPDLFVRGGDAPEEETPGPRRARPSRPASPPRGGALAGLLCLAATAAAVLALWATRPAPEPFFPGPSPAAALSRSLRGAELVLPSPDGVRVRAVWMTPEGEGPFPTLVLNHGGFRGLTPDFLEYAERWREAGFAVAASEYRGQGGSEGKREFAAGEVDDVLTLLRWVRVQPETDPERVAFLGMSHGGTITLLALARSAPVRAAVVQSAVSDAQDMLEREHARALLLRRSVEFDADDPAEVRRRDAFSRIAQVHVPVLVLHGEEDPIVPVRQARRLAEALRGAGVETEIRIFPGAGHNLKGLPEAFEEARRFLARQLALPE